MAVSFPRSPSLNFSKRLEKHTALPQMFKLTFADLYPSFTVTDPGRLQFSHRSCSRSRRRVRLVG